MIPRRIKGFTHVLGAPKNWNAARDGKCVGLAIRASRVRQKGPVECQSAWEPTPEELALLNAGGSVILTVVGRQPPVRLEVEPSIEETDRQTTEER